MSNCTPYLQIKVMEKYNMGGNKDILMLLHSLNKYDVFFYKSITFPCIQVLCIHMRYPMHFVEVLHIPQEICFSIVFLQEYNEKFAFKTFGFTRKRNASLHFTLLQKLCLLSKHVHTVSCLAFARENLRSLSKHLHSLAKPLHSPSNLCVCLQNH